jgi:hypothetical protein
MSFIAAGGVTKILKNKTTNQKKAGIREKMW